MRSKVGGFEGSGIAGEAEVACDPSGRFEIPAIAAGLLEIELIFDREKGTPLRGEAPRGLVLDSGIEGRDRRFPCGRRSWFAASSARRKRSGRSRESSS